MAESNASKFSSKITSDGTIGQGGLAAGVGGTDWQAVKTTSFTAVAGEGYFVNTTSGAITVTLPSSPSAGDYVILKDYARTWGTNAVTLASALIDGATTTSTFSTNGQTITLVYMDGTKGWSLVNEDTTTFLGALYISATGGTITTSGDYKIHTFTGDGCFVVSCAGNPSGSTSVDYLVVAGGGGAGNSNGGGGGAGGMRLGAVSCIPAPISPYTAPGGLPVSATTYPVTVGGGGAGQPPTLPSCGGDRGQPGSNTVFSTITSTGGGGGGSGLNAGPGIAAGSGGSGGGGGTNNGPFGSGNTPPVSPPQGNPGSQGAGPGSGIPYQGGGGGGGHSAAGTTIVPSPAKGGDGGNGNSVTAIFGVSPQPFYSACGIYSGGGGGGTSSPTTAGSGGTGGGGNGNNSGTGTAGTANTGGGAGGGSGPGPGAGGAGGSGVVIIRYKFQ